MENDSRLTGGLAPTPVGVTPSFFGGGIAEFGNKPAGGSLKAPAETGGEILAGVEAASQGDISDGASGVLPQLLRRAIEAASVEEFHGGHIHDFTAVF